MKITLDNNEIEIEQETIDITPMAEADPNWYEECECGIIHKWSCDKEGWRNSSGLYNPEVKTLK